MVMLKTVTIHVIVAVRAYQPQASATKLSQNLMCYAALQCLLSVNRNTVPTAGNLLQDMSLIMRT